MITWPEVAMVAILAVVGLGSTALILFASVSRRIGRTFDSFSDKPDEIDDYRRRRADKRGLK